MRTQLLWLVAAVLAITVSSLPLIAAETAPAEKPPAPEAKAPAAEPAAPPPIREESIYIPYAKLREVFEKEGRGVFLPYEKFQALWQAAREKTAPPPEVKPPVDALITEVDAAATVLKDVVQVAATVRLEVLKEGWNEVPLRLGDAAIMSASLDGQPARIIAAPSGGYKLLVEKKGKAPQQFTLKLEFAKAYTKAPGQNSVSFESPQAPVSKWEVRIPEAGVKVNISPLLAATEVPPAAGAKAEETRVLAFVGAAPTVRIDWTPKAEGAKGLEALASVKVEQQTTIDEGVTRTRAQLAYEISRAELGRLELEVPADQKVVNVFDPNVREWSVAPAAPMQKIVAQLFEPAKQTQNLVVELERFGADKVQDVAVPVVKALGVGRQQGVVVVKIAPGLRAEAAKYTGLMQLDAAELPPALAKGNWDFSYRYAALPFDLVLAIEKVQPRVIADTLVEAHLGTEDLTLDAVTVFTVERAGVFRLEFDIPEGFDVRAVRGVAVGGATAAQVDTHHLEGEKKTRLVVNLSRKALGRVSLEVQLHRALHEPDLLAPTGKAAAVPLPIPRIAPGAVERETGRIVVYAPESLTVNPSKSDGVRVVTAAEAVQDMRSTRRGTERPVLSFAYTQEAVALALAAERRKPYVTVRQLLVARIDSGVVKYEDTLFYDIQYSGVKNLRLDVPKELASEIRIVTTGVRRQVIDDPQALKDLPEGYEAWSLAGETEFLGQGQIRLAWERKIEKLDIGKSVVLSMPRLMPRAADRAWGQIVLVKAETIDVQESAEAGKVAGLRPIDPQQDLMPGAQAPGAARAFEFHEDWTLSVVASMYKLADVKRTSIECALVRVVVTKGEETPVQALYRARCVRQRLLVKLPANITLDVDALRINGRPVGLEVGDKEAGTFNIPLVGQNPDEPFLMELRYAVRGAGLRIDCPAFPEEPAVQKVSLSVYLPQDWDFLGSIGPWTDELVWRLRGGGWMPLARQDDASLIRELLQGVKGDMKPDQNFPTDGRHYLFSTLCPADPPEGSLRLVAVRSDYLAVAVFAVILAIGIILMFTRAAVRVIAAGAFIVLLVLAGVFLPTLARQTADGVMAAAVFIVLVIWAIWYILVTRPRDPRVIASREARDAARQALDAARLAAAKRAAAPPPPPPAADSGGNDAEGGQPHA